MEGFPRYNKKIILNSNLEVIDKLKLNKEQIELLKKIA